MSRTAFVYHPVYQEHFTGSWHPERPERLVAMLEAVESAGLKEALLHLTPSECPVEYVKAVHTERLIGMIKRLCGPTLQHIDSDTVVSEKSYEVALYAAGAGIAAADAIMAGTVENAFCAVRPPGHHAESDRAMGFCLFNNVAVATRYLQRQKGIERVLIVDWDVHHGNGTQEIFYEDPSVLYFSSHQYPYYPGTGSMHEGGSGKGETFTVNAPLRAGCGDPEYRQVYEKMLPKIAEVFQPQFVMVSAGFDGHKDDPLASMQLTEEGFGFLTRLTLEIAQKYCSGRLISMLEGGYGQSLGTSVVAHLKVLAGLS
ncbi:MAG: histone deacetylase [Candidatus Abyssobacteria bacterium SURF_5]|uniref:Histone deacetylase n=1 Tax=Abyssobacteria bacterium (strain SURF_5) TaxID=2093360 RepID=A0A3A4NWA5_ABYX5|nr:MAG: histone deacetylase [Candidatus Abyssubacteria bacterium SURF_5]